MSVKHFDSSERFHVLTHASEILTGVGVRAKDGKTPVEDDLGRILDGALVYSVETVEYYDPHAGRLAKKVVPEKILWVGETKDLPEEYRNAPQFDLDGKHAVIPGLIDCHTHLVFAGDRAGEFAARCSGKTYAEIAASGGGIQTTVRSTREATEDALLLLAKSRAEEAYRYGVRTLEVKSGYGLDHETEMKILRVVKKLQDSIPDMTFVPTYLGAHDFPKEMDRKQYLDSILQKDLPRVANEKLAQSCDVFIDDGFYSLSEGRQILERAKSLGLKVKVHADELAWTGSAELASELEALSADHLLKVSDSGIQALAHGTTTAVLLPGTAFYLKAPHAPARKLINAGARVAIATDFNPGTSMTLNLPAVLTISALYLGLSRAELFAAVTYNAARALDLHTTKGTLEAGKDADFAVLPYPRFEEIYYRFAW